MARWICLLAYALCCALWWTRAAWIPEWDSAIYLLAARSLASGGGYTYLGSPFFLRPPGFSWVLSFFVVGPEIPFAHLNLVIMLFAAATVAAIYLAFQKAGRWTALALALLSGTCPLFVRNFNLILSEFPFAALLFLSLALVDGERPDGDGSGDAVAAGAGWWRSVASGLALAGALYMRTAALVLAPAMLLAAVFPGGEDRGRTSRGGTGWSGSKRLYRLVPAAIGVLLAIPWLVVSSRASARAEKPSEQMLLFNYATAMGHVDPGDPASLLVSPGGWAGRIAGNGAALGRDLADTVLFTSAGWAAALVGLVLLSGLGLSFGRGPRVLDCFALLYAAVLVTYFAYDRRLVMPLAPFVYHYALVAVAAVWRWGFSRIGRAALPAGIFLVVLFGMNIARLPAALRPETWTASGGGTQGQVWKDIDTVVSWVRANTPDGAVLLCSRAPIVSLLTGRRAYTYRFRRSRDPLTKYGIDYVIFDAEATPDLRQLAAARAERCWSLPPSRPGAEITACRIERR